MELKKFIDYAIKLGATDVEIFTRKSILKNVKVETGIFKGTVRRSIETIIRVGVGKRIASQYITSTDTDEIKDTIERTIKVAKSIGEDPYWSGLPEPKKPSLKSLYYDGRLDDLDIHSMMEHLRELDTELPKLDKRVKGVLADIDIITQSTYFMNSNGIEYEENASGEIFYVSVNSKENNIYTSSFEYKRSRQFFDDFLEMGLRAVNKSIEFLHSKKLEESLQKVLFDPLSIAAILGHSLLFGLSADYVLEGASPLKGKLNTMIGNEKLTILDDGTIPGGWRTSLYDDEGVPRKRTVIVDKGELKSYLHNHYTAERMNVESTGNAERRGTAVTVYPSNIVFKEGDYRFDETLKEIDKGVYVTGHPLSAHTINISTGDASVVFQEAYYIEKGEIKEPLKPITLSGNIYEALKKFNVLKGMIETPYNIYIPPIYTEAFLVR